MTSASTNIIDITFFKGLLRDPKYGPQDTTIAAMDQPTWQSLLPPIIAIATALITKQVFLSLFAGIWLGWILLDGGNPILGLRDALESMVAVFLDRGNALILIFSAQIGAFIALTQRSGGVEGFVNWIVDRGYVRTAKGARLLPSVIGLGLFLESNLTCLISGAVARPLFDRFRLSREKLAYLCDSTAAPVCVLFPFNAYGAVIMGILASQNIANPLGLLLSSIVFNFYALFAIAFVFYIAISGRDWGPMARAETRARETGKVLRDGATPLVSDEVLSLPTKEGATPRARNMVVPTLVLLATVLFGLYLTDGDGSTAIFWAMSLAVVLAAGMSVGQRIFTVQEAIDITMRGIGGLVPVLVLIVMAFALGATTRELQAGRIPGELDRRHAEPNPFTPSPLRDVGRHGLRDRNLLGDLRHHAPHRRPDGRDARSRFAPDGRRRAGGAIFGDHSSPISDTTIVASLAAGSDHIDHVNTQLPYALPRCGGERNPVYRRGHPALKPLRGSRYGERRTITHGPDHFNLSKRRRSCHYDDYRAGFSTRVFQFEPGENRVLGKPRRGLRAEVAGAERFLRQPLGVALRNQGAEHASVPP